MRRRGGPGWTAVRGSGDGERQGRQVGGGLLQARLRGCGRTKKARGKAVDKMSSQTGL